MLIRVAKPNPASPSDDLLPKRGEHGAERLAAVADGKFAQTRDFSERTAERRIIEKWIVTEALGSARFLCNKPLDCAAEYAANLCTLNKSNRANETRGPRFHAAEPLQQQTVVGFISGMRSCESRRVNARCST